MGDHVVFPETTNKEGGKVKKLLQCMQSVNFGVEPVESNQLCCKDIRVVCSPGTHTSGSSKVKLTNVVDFNWDLKNYPGQLIAVHIRGNFFAYGLKAMGKSEGTSAGMIRVVSAATGQRGLIRGLRGMVQDLAFSHMQQEVVLACVDQGGILLVHRIEEKSNVITTTLLLHVERDEPSMPMEVHRVVWCPYIPEEGAQDKEVGLLLVLTRGPHAEMWCVPLVNARHGAGPLTPRQVSQGLLQVPALDSTITDAAFSPDGTALAIASAGGLVSFFQVYMHNHAIPRCLHSWRPHGEKPLTTLYFLDNHKDYNPDIQFWKWAITGAKDNSEIKLWACESWTCLQTLTFEPNPNAMSPSGNQSSRCILKAALDLSSRYLVLSDVYNRMMYVLQLQLDEGPAHVGIISGFTLPQPAMSFCIFEAGLRAPTNLHERPDGEEEDGEIEFEDEGVMTQDDVSSVLLKMFVVQPKSLQEVRLAFKPNAKPPTLSHDTLVFHEENGEASNSEQVNNITTAAAAADLPANHSGTVKQTPVSEALNTSAMSTSSSLNLMTPEAFSSPARHEDSPSRASNVSSSGGSVKRITHTPPPPQDLPQPSELTPVQVEKVTDEMNMSCERDGAMASGGSSPSREVQQILALQDTNDLVDDDFFDGKLDVPEEIEIEEKVDVEVKQDEQDSSGYEWPQIPMLPMDQPSVPTDTLVSVSASVPAPVLLPSDEIVEELRAMRNCMQSLTIVVEQQQAEIKSLRGELNNLAPQTTQTIQNSMDQSLKYQLQRHSQSQDTLLRDKLTEMREQLSSSFAKTLDSVVTQRLSQCLKNEVNTQLVPVVLQSMQPLKDIIHNEMTKKLTATDNLLKERLSQLASSQHVQAAVASSVTTALQMHFNTVLRDVLLSNLMPSFEKLIRTMFSQINETFSRGTREHLAAVEAQMDKVRQRNLERSKETTGQITAQITTLSEAVRVGHDATANMVRTELNTAVATAVVGLQESVARASREAVSDAVARALREQQTTTIARPDTPQSRIDPQAQMTTVLNLVSQGQLNAAFQQALSASDLTLVVKLCERVNPQHVFNQTPCPLQQPVLLSLIQQLSADLNHNTELKHKYLAEAVMNIDPTSAVAREHMSNVLHSLHKQLTLYIQTNPNLPITRNLRMLLMATQSLIKT